MPLETATYIHQLNSANPLGSDPIAAGDDHLRLIKAALQATFPNIAGAVSPSHTDLNTRLMPSGAIIMWSGSIASIPTGWVLCDGSNGTPDLRSRFIVGAGSNYAVGNTGGVDSVTLTESQIPSHTHTITASSGAAGGHNHSVNDPGHRHNMAMYVGSGSGFASIQAPDGPNPTFTNNYMQSATTGISLNGVGDHTHTISATASNTGAGAAHENRPPFHALAYIMKV